MRGELHRIKANDSGGEVASSSIRVIANCIDADRSLERVKEVMCLVAGESDAGTWPTDEEWAQKLPLWFIEPFEGRTTEMLWGDDDLWDFESWLDAMRQRGWEWWSSRCKGNQWSAILIRQEYVYSIDPLIYLAKASGASSIEVTEDPI